MVPGRKERIYCQPWNWFCNLSCHLKASQEEKKEIEIVFYSYKIIYWYCNKATLIDFLVILSFIDGFTTNFALQMFSCIFLKMTFLWSFELPPIFVLVLFILLPPNLSQVFMKGCSTNLLRLFFILMKTLEVIPSWAFYLIILLLWQRNLLKSEIAQ